MKKLSLVIVMVSVTAFATFTGAQGKTDPALDKLNAEFTAAFNAKDAARLASFYTEDALLMPPNQPMVKGRPNIEAFWRGAFEQGLTNLRLRPLESVISGNQAFEAGTATLTVKTGGTAMTGTTGAGGAGASVTDSSKYIVVFKRTETGWRMAYDIFNSDAPLPPAKK